MRPRRSFFLFGSAALCKGRGEIVQPTKLKKKLSISLLKPAFGVSSAWAYSRWQDSTEIPGVSYAPQTFPWGELRNDLERPVFEKHVFLAMLKTWLLAQPETAGKVIATNLWCFDFVVHKRSASSDPFRSVPVICRLDFCLFGHQGYSMLNLSGCARPAFARRSSCNFRTAAIGNAATLFELAAIERVG